jgi:predicted regulator of amino acid metabolism with ACT domain
MKPWVLVLRVHTGTRSGLMARVGRIFADRGISLSDVLATARDVPTLVVCFEATERMRDYMVRRLSRLEEVEAIEVHASDGRAPWEHRAGPLGE